MVDYLPLDIFCLRLDWRTVLQNDWWLKAAQSLWCLGEGFQSGWLQREERAGCSFNG